MSTSISAQLHEYYLAHGIHPQKFVCQHRALCSGYAHQGNMTEAKMSMVGSAYSIKYPKIVVISLDPPSGREGIFSESNERTVEYISITHESENYSVNRPNTHWAMTQIIVKELLTLFGYQPQPGSAVVGESYSGRSIDNVSAYFAHVNVAKCSMNNPNKGQASRIVHKTCSSSYLMREIEILQPDILITQGKVTNEIAGELLIDDPILESDLPKIFEISICDGPTLWLPMRHPTRQLDKIRKEWETYFDSVRDWNDKVKYSG